MNATIINATDTLFHININGDGELVVPLSSNTCFYSPFTRKSPFLSVTAKDPPISSFNLIKFRLGIVILFGLLAALYSVVTPGWEAPDERGHYEYVLYLRQTLTLPVQGENAIGAAHHAPLYYVIAALFSLPADLSRPSGKLIQNPNFMYHGLGNDVNFALHKSNETFPYRNYALFLHLVRLASVALGMATVWFVFKISEEIFPQRPEITTLAGLLVAFNPQFLFISGAVNNDNLVTLAVTVTLWQFLQAIRKPDQLRQWFLVGIWVAVATLAKANGLLVVMLPALGIVIAGWRRRSYRLVWNSGIALTLPIIVGTSWWFIRNWLLYGDLLGWSKYNEVFSINRRITSIGWPDILDFFFTQFKSFWAAFGWMNIWASPWFYQAIFALYAVGLIGLLLFILWQRRKLSTFQIQSLISLGFLIVLFEGYMLWAIRQFNASWYQGRYIFLIIAPLMISLSIGICTVTPIRYTKWLIGMLGLLLGLNALYMPLGVIAPAYPMKPLPQWKLYFLQNKTQHNFGDMFVLRGYQIDVNENTVTLDLYWQAKHKPDFDYTVFVHLINDQDAKIAQLDQVPGEKQNYPPTTWYSGDIVLDQHSVTVSRTDILKSPKFYVGLYNWQTGKRIPLIQDGTSAADFVVIQPTLP